MSVTHPTLRRPKRRERGSIVVLFALVLPVFLAIGAIVVTVGNWYVLKRHLQTQVDAAALAGGPAATGCSQVPAAATAAVAQYALRYAGDPTRDVSTDNLLMQDALDVHAVLNSDQYWESGDPTDGSAHDWTIATPGTPCDTKYLDVKATDDSAPLLWGFIPFAPSLEARARVRFSEIFSTDGLRPLGVPEVNPQEMAVLVVDEADGSIVGKSLLDPQTTPPSGLADMSVWSRDFISSVDLSGDRDFGVIIVASRTTIDLTQTLAEICSPASGQVQCYGGSSPTSGISFIHAYRNAPPNGNANNPIVRSVSLSGGCPDPADLSKPYFNFEGGCPLTITAEVDFGTGAADPTPGASSGGVCAEVSSPQVQGSGQLNWSGGLWSGTVNANADGPTTITLSWQTDTIGDCGGGQSQKVTGSFGKVAKPYASDAASGPVQYLKIETAGGFGLANSIPQNASAGLKVTVGLIPPLRENQLTDPPVALRFWDTPSQTQALDCASGSSGWGGAMELGCSDPFQIYDDSKHTSKCDPLLPATEPADCIASQNGNFNQNDVIRMLANPCGPNPNRWDGTNVPPTWDKRWMPLFILDEMAYTDSGKNWYPIRRFGMFYVTAVSGMNCPGDIPATVPTGKREMWGHFMSFVTPGFGTTIPSDVDCSFQAGTLCVSNLVE